MANSILGNGALVTLGIVGVVAAVGAANKAGLYGSHDGSVNMRDDEDVAGALMHDLAERGIHMSDMGEGTLVDDDTGVNVTVRSGLVLVGKMLYTPDGDLIGEREFGDFPLSRMADIVKAIQNAMQA